MDKLISNYKKQYPDGIVRENELMSIHTSFRVGGAVRWMFFPKTAEEVKYIIEACREAKLRYMVVGNGSNLLVADRLPEMAVIKTDRLCEIKADENKLNVRAGTGALLSKTASCAMNYGMSGLEFAHGIPGSVGGAVYMNAGAYGGEMKDVVKSVTVLDRELFIKTYAAEDCEFSYRHSRFENTEDIILEAEFALDPGEREKIKERMNELAAKRREKQPLDMPSAGSTFKRPKEGYAAAMIDQCGLRGFSIGGAQVSEKHAGFVINKGGATFSDVIELMEHVKKTVLDKFGTELEPEVRIVK